MVVPWPHKESQNHFVTNYEITRLRKFQSLTPDDTKDDAFKGSRRLCPLWKGWWNNQDGSSQLRTLQRSSFKKGALKGPRRWPQPHHGWKEVRKLDIPRRLQITRITGNTLKFKFVIQFCPTRAEARVYVAHLTFYTVRLPGARPRWYTGGNFPLNVSVSTCPITIL